MLVFLLLWAENTLGNRPLMGCEIQVLASQASKYPDNPKFLLHPFYGSARKTYCNTLCGCSMLSNVCRIPRSVKVLFHS